MRTPGADEISEVLDRVNHWPTPSRLILESIDASTDEECRRIVAEERWMKHGP